MPEEEDGLEEGLEDGLSPCRALCAEDCILTIAGDACPDSCDVCLYWERWVRNACQWTPQPSDKQYQHWNTRGDLPCNLSRAYETSVLDGL